MKCPNCGYENRESSNFCLKCGTRLEKTAAAAPVSEQGKSTEAVSASVTENITEAVRASIPDNTAKAAPVSEQKNTAEAIPFSMPEKTSETENSYNTGSDIQNISKIKPNTGKIPLIAGAVAAVAVIIGISVFLGRNKDTEDIAADDTSVSSYSETEKSTETVSETTTAATKKANTTTKAETAAAYTEDVSDEYGGPITYDLKGVSVVFDEDNEYYDEGDYYTSYCTYTPKVTMTSNRTAAEKIEKDMAAILSLDSEKTGSGKKVSQRPEWQMGNMSYENSVANVFTENGMLFATFSFVTDMGGGTSSSVYGWETTYIYDMSDGSRLALDDFVSDRQGFFNAVDDYICDTVYYNTYVEPDNDNFYGSDHYALNEDVDYDTFVKDVLNNPWYENEWTYDGENLTAAYHYLLGMQTIYKETIFTIPKYVWSDYVDFSSVPSERDRNKAPTDSLGFKIMSGNTAGNYANYSGYCFDKNYMYYAGGIDGYHWQLRKNYIGGYGSDGELISDDMTDAVMIDGDTIYYRNATDGYTLYSIGTDGTGKKKLTDTKASAARLYDNHIYFTSEGKLYRMNMDGSGKTKILDKPCYDLQIYDDHIYITSEDNSSVEIYDMSGSYYGSLHSAYTKSIKWFFVSEGNCVMANEDSISIINVQTGAGACHSDVNITGIGESKYDYLAAMYDAHGEYVCRIPKNDIGTIEYYDDISSINGREFFIVYDDYSTYIYTFDKDGAVTSKYLGGY